jgi:acyl-CoA synthetase (AMP-forming)/AMP-acid ligase II
MSLVSFGSLTEGTRNMIGRPVTPPTEASILEILNDRARRLPDREIFCFLEDGELETETLTYARLQRRARAVAAALQSCSQPGDRVLLVYPPGLECIAALFGCFEAGVIAVPVCPPRWELLGDGLAPLAGIVEHCRPAVLLTGGVVAERLSEAVAQRPEFAQTALRSTDSISDAEGDGFRGPAIGRETTALLQYTSGSTGDPRGVMLTHGNILHNEYAQQCALQHRTAARSGGGVCWLPFYHDMSLMGNVLQAVYVDGPSWQLPPVVLLQHPLRWLQAITKYQAHTSGGPNFAYDLCVRRITAEQKATLDLSHWEVAAIGAEPVSAATIDRFSEAFACCGFRREAFYPCYGLAEATLFVSGGDKNEPPVVRMFAAADLELRSRATEAAQPRILDSPLGTAQSTDEIRELPKVASTVPHQTLVGCGHAWADHEIVIVDPDAAVPCPPGVVGEIWFAGPSVGQGYWRDEQASADRFCAHLSDSGRGPFLRTGDLGFFNQGHLFICGRIKDLIVIRGRNHYPQDIEETVFSIHEAFAPNSGAAFGCPVGGEERLVILQEIDRRTRRVDLNELARSIRAHIAEVHQLQVHDVVFLRNGSLPKTTSGKIRRHEARRQYIQSELIPWKPKPRP